ncbi:MAG: hypothetical protein J6Y80_02325, partial [Victivallales bacterium]|nr:hypothetical protein [Victivallales bacterium]
MKCLTIGCLLLAVLSLSLHADARVNVARIPYCTVPPALDGVLAPGEWDGAAALSDFCSIEEKLAPYPGRTY